MKKKRSHQKYPKNLYFLATIIFAVILLVLVFASFNKNMSGGKEMSQSKIENLSDTYPEHPNLENCENTSKRNFCIGDVAEINNDINLCYQITDPDIKNFCIARISLDRNLCSRLSDEGLRGACLESIELKINWSRGL